MNSHGGPGRAALMVLNWNGAEWMRRCLPSVIAAAARESAEVWVVDNQSTDESGRVCREEFPSVRFFPAENRVLASYNLAAQACDREVLVFLNNDLAVDEGFLAPLLAHFDEDSTVFSVSPCMRSYPPGPESVVELEAHEPRWRWGMLRGAPVGHSRAVPTFYASGGAMACRRDRFLELGGFDDRYLPGYHEDVDLGWRAWRRGWSCWYEPASTVYHAGGASMGRSPAIRSIMTRNELLFHWKNLSPPWLAVHLALLPARLASQALRGDTVSLRGFGQACARLWRRGAGDAAKSRPQLSDGAAVAHFTHLVRRAARD